MNLDSLGISGKDPAFIVAEVSANHQGLKENCINLIDIAAESGANAVKFQTYRPETITLDTAEEDFLIPEKSPWFNYTNLYNLYSHASTPWEWHKDLFDYTRSRNLIPFSSAFDESAVELLESLNCSIYKLASPEINHTPLIAQMAKTGKPIIVSLGVASQYDINKAVEIIRATSNSEIVIMQCDTSYPAEFENANINQIPWLAEDFDCIIGYSDHTLSSVSAIVSIALGAKVIEKHLASNDKDETIDSFFSASKDQFFQYIKDIRIAESTLGRKLFRTSDSDKHFFSKRSIYPKVNIEKGSKITEDNIGIFRPGLSLEPEKFVNLIGKVAVRDLRKGERISELDFI